MKPQDVRIAVLTLLKNLEGWVSSSEVSEMLGSESDRQRQVITQTLIRVRRAALIEGRRSESRRGVQWRYRILKKGLDELGVLTDPAAMARRNSERMRAWSNRRWGPVRAARAARAAEANALQLQEGTAVNG